MGFTGSIPTEISKLQALETLALRKNALTGTIPTNLSNLTKLVHFDVGMNNLAGTIADIFSNQNSLEIFQIDYNRLSGEIPHMMGSLSSLAFLNLGSNFFSASTLPSFICKLSNLRGLSVYNLDVIGKISGECFSNLSELEMLSFSMTDITGTLPTELGLLPNLKAFTVSQSLLTGNLPSVLGLLTQLTFLDLTADLLIGSIPSEVQYLSNLRYLSFGDSLYGNLETVCNATSYISNRQYIVKTIDLEARPHIQCSCCSFSDSYEPSQIRIFDDDNDNTYGIRW
mmetsp:Transcript_23144/g.33161  ORF Transcript_23144/g.33161 Transcript_23144/m.33161 type:complete len:284 (-) Transcript_23144:308-1159(-)